MADAADSTPAPGGQFALTVADLNTTVNHEPRVEDLKVAKALGYADVQKIRALIERHREALERFGEVSATVAETSRRGGRPGRTFWLNKRQALYLCTKSETPRATETTIAMVEVFDAHLAARAVPPPAGPAPLAPVPFLPGPERLVSSLHLAQALRRRHTGVLRLADILAAERPELLGAHLRFATYLHENGRPYRCFHLTRAGFDALMARVPSADGLAAALRDATLRGWPDVPALPAPAAPGAGLDRDGLAVMRIAGEVLTVDLARWHTGADGRAVVFDHDGEVTMEAVEDEPMLVPIHGRRVARARRLTTKPYQPGIDRPALWVLGVVVGARPATAPGERAPGQGPRPHSAPKRGALPPPRAAADLLGLAVRGTA